MKINKEQLISLLAERTGMDRGDINMQFVELIGRIQQAEEENNTLNIEGFGTFMAVHDRLEFVPADIFETEINNKYAGMKPIELIGAYKEPDGEEVPVVVPPEKEELARESKEPSGDEREEKTEATDAEEATPVEEPVPEEPTVPPVDQSDKQISEQAEDVPPSEEKEEPAVAEVEVSAKADKSEEEQKAVGKAAEPVKKDPIGKAMLIIMAVLALAIAGWMAYDFGLFDSENSSSSPATTEPTTEQQESVNNTGNPDAEAGSKAVNPAEEKQAQDQQPAQIDEQSTAAAEPEPYGLYGELNTDLSSGYYTIVVHSLRTRQLAEEKVQEMEGENFRIKINPANVNGQTYFRVGVGQFSTIRAAQEAVRELPEPYKSNNFINRF